MPDDAEISALPEATAVDGSFTVVGVQAGVTKRATLAVVQEGVVPVFSRTVELTDAQIKALPTTGIEVIPAPGEGKVPVLLRGIAMLDWTADYTNISASSLLYLYGATSNAMNLASQDQQTGMSALFAGGTDRWVISSSWQSEYATEAWGWAILPRPLDAEPANQAVTLFMENSDGNLTGGNAANTLKVTVLYSIIDVA